MPFGAPRGDVGRAPSGPTHGPRAGPPVTVRRAPAHQSPDPAHPVSRVESPSMEWEFIAPMVMSTVFILTVGGVLVLRPLSKRLAELLEVYTRDKQSLMGTEVHQIRELLETMNARLQLIEERQDFTEKLLTTGDRSRERNPSDPS